jgi:hypothetical protein
VRSGKGPCVIAGWVKTLPNPLMRLAFILTVAILTGACGESHTTTQQTTVSTSATFSRIQFEIFNQSCAVTSCHDTATHQSGLDLSVGNSYVQIVNIAAVEMPSLKRVAPYDPTNSFLFQKMNSTTNVGVQMPPGASPLSTDQLNLVRDWILSGAPNN